MLGRGKTKGTIRILSLVFIVLRLTFEWGDHLYRFGICFAIVIIVIEYADIWVGQMGDSIFWACFLYGVQIMVSVSIWFWSKDVPSVCQRCL